MSHLSTIIARVKRRLGATYRGNEKAASESSIWLQSIHNLKEYMEQWTDFTPEEAAEANALYAKYTQYLKHKKWSDEDLMDFAKVTTQGSSNGYEGCVTVSQKLARFEELRKGLHSSQPNKWSNADLIEFAKAVNGGPYGDYTGCKTTFTKLERFKELKNIKHTP